MAKKNRDEKGRFLKEGKSWITPKGYLMIWYENSNRLLHEVIWEKEHGKKPKDMQIHHINFIKTDNRLENFELVTRETHQRIHAGWIRNKEGNFIAKSCTKCKRVLSLNEFYDRRGYGIGYSNPSARCKKCHNQ